MSTTPRVLAAVLLLTLSAGCGGAGAPSSPDEIDLAAMESYGCGYGFWLGSPEQDVAVNVAVADHDAAVRGELPDRTQLPDRTWEATVLVGRDLFANWCDDVLEPGEPEPVVDQRWEITAGTIRLHAPAPEERCPSEVTATLEGLVATRADGTSVELGDREVTNDTWGCFAG